MTETVAVLWAVFLALLVLIILWAVVSKTLRLRKVTILEYQRGLLYRRGRFGRVLGPGQYWISDSFSMIAPVDVRNQFLPVPGQEVISKDGVSLKTSLAAEYKVSDPAIAINQNYSYVVSLYGYLQGAMRELAGGTTMDELLTDRSKISKALFEAVLPKAKTIGLELISAEVKDLMLPGELKKVFTQVLQAQKEGLAALERARGETAALRNLANAAKLLEEHPGLLQLRVLQAVGASTGNTVVVGGSGFETIPLKNRALARKSQEKSEATE